MKKIEVLGTGCKKCAVTAEQITTTAKELGIEVEVTKVTDPQIIMHYQVMSTPAVAVNGQLAHSGGVPDRKKIEAILKA
ncbi:MULTISPECIES: thioredoxin family protein [Halomonadaceae]|uniref:Thioredoxin family protein n=2 Tax=Vreelandella TaxID=3137766 RepID=A0A7Z0RZX9_9GAMM|nr:MULTISPECIES: thioredoxin family protein [Halomonas]NYS79802.1 thioredoxin family protein [Halomonas glaciei]|tara:strand:- start:7661 stop:7897 length:237 start_codon:yes stop_codon:yes gene_type:complete